MNQPTHIVLLGRQPELGLVELESLIGAAAIEPFGRQLALLNRSIEVARLGGVIKLGRIIYRGAATDLQELPIDAANLPMAGSKTPFALSLYADRISAKAVEAAGLTLKKRLRERGSSRLIAPSKGTEVSVAQLKHNRVLEAGFELIICIRRDEMIIALTEQIQDIDWYSRRDYERPARSAKVGMLPPKLAQILINTTKSPVVVDPFCGTGVVLQEALLLGREAAGSDLSGEMVAAARTNLEWLGGEVSTPLPAWSADEADARQIKLPKSDLAIVSEGYLGPNLTSTPPPDRLDGIRSELKLLYQASLVNWAHQIESGTELALCVPAWRQVKGWAHLELVDEAASLGYNVKVFEHADGPLLYARDDQFVGRQLLLLRKS